MDRIDVTSGSLDIYLPALPRISDSLSASPSLVQLTITSYVVGIAVGQLVIGPLSDVHGRRRPLMAGMTAFAIVSVLCAFAPNIYVLSGLRCAQGMLAATGMVIGRAVVRDCTRAPPPPATSRGSCS